MLPLGDLKMKLKKQSSRTARMHPSGLENQGSASFAPTLLRFPLFTETLRVKTAWDARLPWGFTNSTLAINFIRAQLRSSGRNAIDDDISKGLTLFHWSHSCELVAFTQFMSNERFAENERLTLVTASIFRRRLFICVNCNFLRLSCSRSMEFEGAIKFTSRNAAR